MPLQGVRANAADVADLRKAALTARATRMVSTCKPALGGDPDRQQAARKLRSAASVLIANDVSVLATTL